MSLERSLDKILEKHSLLSKQLVEQAGNADEFIRLSKEFAELERYVDVIKIYKQNLEEERNLTEMLSSADIDDDLRKMAEEEIRKIQQKLPKLEKDVQVILLPKEASDEKNAIIEIRAGTGGDEAGIFAGDLLRMYQRYSDYKGWKFETLYINESDLGSIKEAAASISGPGVFSFLKFESGVHRVQRVPVTESSGRIHTSTATVAVLPEAEEIDVAIDDKDLKIDVMRASGAGGQHVNKTESAVRITHIPSGIVVFQQDERSQHMNKLRAMKILRAKLFDAANEKANADRASDRKQQIGTGERSERIRTYNFPQGRVTDHRINLTLYKIEQIMQGDGLDEMILSLIEEYQAKRISEFMQDDK